MGSRAVIVRQLTAIISASVLATWAIPAFPCLAKSEAEFVLPRSSRFFGSLKAETLDRMIFFSEKMLRQAIHSYLDHYHRCRNHQGLENRLLEPGVEVGRIDGEIRCRESLGGLLKYYHRSAA